VVPDRQTLNGLLELARAADPASINSGPAPVIGWWALRADHPGTGAVLDLITACSARWVLGVPPTDERDLRTWPTWLHVADRGPGGLLEIAAAVSAGTTLPGLEAFAEDDRDSWELFGARTRDPKSPWDWRRRDSRREAALGLATRCDATELGERLRLGDPLVTVRESFAGTVVTGIVTALPARRVVELTLDSLACRLRENTAIEGFPGYPRDLPPSVATGAGSAPLVRGRVVAGPTVPSRRAW
jgi:hypothetical protein